MPSDYEQLFVQAELTFVHQLVWDPAAAQVVPLTPYPPGLTAAALPFAGPCVCVSGLAPNNVR